MILARGVRNLHRPAVDISGTAVWCDLKTSTALFDGKHFLRVDPDGTVNANYIICLVVGNETTWALYPRSGYVSSLKKTI